MTSMRLEDNKLKVQGRKGFRCSIVCGPFRSTWDTETAILAPNPLQVLNRQMDAKGNVFFGEAIIFRLELGGTFLR